MHFLTPNTTYGDEHHAICSLALLLLTKFLRRRALLCLGSHVCACSACCHRGLSIMERIFLSCPQSNVPSPPLMQTQIKRSSLNGTQMWNVSAELHLRQRPLRGFLFPESHNTRKTVPITPLRHEPAKRSRSVWKENTSTFSVFTCQNRLLLECSRTRRKNKDTKGNFSF